MPEKVWAFVGMRNYKHELIKYLRYKRHVYYVEARVVELRNDVKTSNLIDTFICHSIFYVIFCYSLCLYVFIDLGFGFFLKNKVNRWLKVQKIIEIPSLSVLFPINTN